MKTIPVSISDSEYEAYRQAASERSQLVEELLQEAIRFYRVERFEKRDRLEDLPLFKGPQLIGTFPIIKDDDP